MNPEAARLARGKLAAVIHANVESLEFLPYPEGYFDCITTGDVLEHLVDPEAVLARLLKYLSPQGVLVCSIPNIRHQSVLLDLAVNGRWQYQDEGLLDRTHLRFFTLIEIRQMLERLGLEAGTVTASQSPPVAAMEPIFEAVAKVGGDAEALRQESRIIQYIFQATPKDRVVQPPATGSVRVRIVIPVFNQASLTESCLYAIAGNTDDDPDYEAVVVDNGSTDWTRYLLHAFEGDIQVVNNDQNLGFAQACNLGNEGANAEYLLFLNNDTEPQQGWLEEMVALADSDPQIGIVGAKLVYPDSGQIQHAGIAMINGLPEHVYRGLEADDPQVNQLRDYDMVTGACLLIRRAVFNQIGGFDTDYLNGVEDVDLCLRVREAGFRVVYCPTSLVVHHEGQSEGRYDRVQENLQRFMGRWQGRFDEHGRLRTASQTAVLKMPRFEAVESTEQSATAEIQSPVSNGPTFGALATDEQIAAASAADFTGRVHWHGSFFVHSSLAYVNRELTLALMELGVGQMDLEPFEADQFGADEDPRFKDLAERFTTRFDDGTDISIRHRWPPDFTPAQKGLLVIYQPWEYGRIPQTWVLPLQQQVDQIWAYTAYVRNCYIDSGVAGKSQDRAFGG
jgi:GT2 family glycosyltransferase